MGHIRVADLIRAADEAGLEITPEKLLKPGGGSLRRKAKPEEEAAETAPLPADPPQPKGSGPGGNPDQGV